MGKAISSQRFKAAPFTNSQIIYRSCLALFVFLFWFSTAFSQTSINDPVNPTRILFLFDASQSMYGQWQSATKIDVAKKLLSKIVDSLRVVDNLQLGLHVFGHLKKYPPQDCDDNRLEVPFSKKNHDKIIEKINSIRPSGTTPIARSLEECEKDFPDSKTRNIIILITDGLEECGGDPCAVSLALQKKGIMLRPFVIGIGDNADYQKAFDCVGTYYNAANETNFFTVLNVVISQALNNTTAQVNLLDAFGKPTETNVDMTFYDEFTKEIRYNFIHTINYRGNPDTLRIDPLSSYRIVVHTIPPVEVDSVRLNHGKHTLIPIDAPQGFMILKYDGISEYKKLQAIVRKKETSKTLHVQDFNTSEKYIVGKYDLEVLCLPRLIIKDVDIRQSHTTTVQIPQPGLITLLSNSSSIGALFVEENNKLTWCANLDENQTKQTIILQPGNYRAIVRPKNSKESGYTVQKSFKIVSGSSYTLTLY